MADGPYRFSQASGQQYYSQYNNTRHLHQRPSSPAQQNHRRGFPSDTPSPSRSPRTRSPSSHAYSMYTQNHGGNNLQHMMNGGGHQRFGNQLNLNKFSHHNPHQHNQHAQTGQDGGHGTHQGNFISHQHNPSGGASGHFGGAHLQNGAQNNAYNNANASQTEHWKKQIDIAAEIRNLTHAHPHARNASTASKTVIPGSSTGGAKDGHDKREERYRTTGDWSDDETEPSIWTEIDMGGSNLRCVSLQLFDYYPFLTKLYLNNNRLQVIPPEIGHMRNLAHLDLSLNQITTLPPEMGMLVNLRALLLVDNKIEVIPYELGNLFALEMLAIDGNPLNEDQLGVIAEEGPQALIRQLRESAPGPDPPHPRDWIVLDDTDSSSDDKFQVISFNILCKIAATPQQFGYSPLHTLEWDFRKELILQEIRTRDVDIVCLQELDVDNYNNLFREMLARSDYKGVYWPRSKSKTMSVEQGKGVDGCATFIKNSKYIILDKQVIDFGNISINRADMKGEHDLFNRVMIRDNIGVVTFLENRSTGSRLIVVNTHLYWDQNYRDVKVVQATILMEETQKLAEKYAKWPPTPDKDKIRFRYANGDKEGEEPEEEVVQAPVPSMSYATGTDIPMIVCGDFNSTPRSGVYEMLTTGQLAGNHRDLGTYKYGNITKDGVRHAFSLKSSYGNVGELPFTNYTPGFTGVLDYILYSTSSLSCTGLLGEVDPEYLKRVPGFPNVHFPSDHLLLQSEFKAKAPRKERKITEVDFGPQKENRRG